MSGQDDNFSGIGNVVAGRLLASLGITQDQLDKVKTIVDNIDVKENDSFTEIIINLKKITIKIEK